MPGGLRAGRDQRRRHAPRPPGRRHAATTRVGGLSDGPRMASDIDVFVRPEEAVEITRGIAQVFGELGDRENRWTARMRYLVQELGPELPRRAGARLGRPHARRRGSRRRDTAATTSASTPNVGRFGAVREPPLLRRPERACRRMRRRTIRGRWAGLRGVRGRGPSRHGPELDHHGVPEDRLDDLLGEPLLARYSPNLGRSSVVACTGSEFCRFGIVETKVRAVSGPARWTSGWATSARRP